MAIEVNLKCKNIAPLANLDSTFANNSLKVGIYASNGSGKTYLSRMFRLFELRKEVTIPHDQLITMGQHDAKFAIRIKDNMGSTVEDAKIDVSMGSTPIISEPHYLYHTFNQDYVDENIRTLNYEHTGDVQGFILGKTNIDISDEQAKLTIAESAAKKIYDEITEKIQTYIAETISPIRDIRRLGEYNQYISADVFIENGLSKCTELSKNVKEYIADYDKVKSVPEELADIPIISTIIFDRDIYEEMISVLSQPYTLGMFAESFKMEVRSKQDFIEKGLTVLGESRVKCPFCGQDLKADALKLIDQYNAFLEDEESKIIKRIKNLVTSIEDVRKTIQLTKTKCSEIASKYDEYKSKYIPSCEGNRIDLIDVKPILDLLNIFQQALAKKLIDISAIVEFDSAYLEQLQNAIYALNVILQSNNTLIGNINKRKGSIKEESKNIRRNICIAAYNHWWIRYGNEQKKYQELQKQIKEIKAAITLKQESVKVERKKLVAQTIKQVLSYFFTDKYTLDEETFQLVFHSTPLVKNQTKHVLSEGEKNIVAFAYYLGDTHTLIEKEDDYNKLFFVIDDPISSMDFTYVYTISGMVREMNSLFPKITKPLRQLVLTHNTDFIRILSSNNILDKVLHLKNGALDECKENFTVPYVSHLLDIYQIARKGVKASHTTANSIRHIIETINKFEEISTTDNSIKNFIKERIPDNKSSYTFINDLSHGGWRTDQEPMTDDDYRDVCETVIQMIEKHYPKQIKYCEEILK